MKKILVLVALLAIVGVAGAWQPGQGNSSAEEAVKARIAAFGAAWNKSDAEAMAQFWSPDGDLINPFGRVAKGRPAVMALLKDEHAMTFKGSKFSEKVNSVRTIGDGTIALTDSEVTITGGHNQDGTDMAPMVLHCSIVMQQASSGAWMYESARPYAFMTPPAPMKSKTPAK